MAPRKTRIRRTNRQIFLDKLLELSHGEQTLVGSINLREHLGWDEGKYNSVKDQLLWEDAIIVGRGRGGSVGLAQAPGTKAAALSVFISYSHVDDHLKAELVKHLKPLERLHYINAWHDGKIKPGDLWERSILKEIESSDIILLLVSIDFINSKYCYEVELERALELHASGKAKVIPIILRSCLWHQMTFGKLQALPREGRPVKEWPDQDQALAGIAEGVRQIAEELRSAR